MDFINPRQHRDVSHLYATARRSIQRTFRSRHKPRAGTLINGRVVHTAKSDPESTETALVTIGGLNLLYPLAKLIIQRRARLDILAETPSWLTTDFVLERRIRVAVNEATREFMNLTILSDVSLSAGRWHTLLTTHFVHESGREIILNSLLLLGITKPSTNVPSMNALHVAGVALTSSLCTSAIPIAWFSTTPNATWSLHGSASISRALASVDACDRLRTGYLAGGEAFPHNEVFNVALWFATNEAVSWFTFGQRAMTSLNALLCATAYLSGGAYYLLFMRPANSELRTR